jgi:hypothetical protein
VFVYPYRGIIIFVREIHSGMYTPSWHHSQGIKSHGRFILTATEMEDTTEYKGKWIALSEYLLRLKERVQQGEKLTQLPRHSGNPVVTLGMDVDEKRKKWIEEREIEVQYGRQKRWERAPEDNEEQVVNVPMAICLTFIGIILVTCAYLMVLQSVLEE